MSGVPLPSAAPCTQDDVEQRPPDLRALRFVLIRRPMRSSSPSADGGEDGAQPVIDGGFSIRIIIPAGDKNSSSVMPVSELYFGA